MRKQITIFIASHSGALVKQLTVPRAHLTGLTLVIVACLAVAGYVFVDYGRLHQKAAQARRLSETIASQDNILGDQRRQIEEMADRINKMKSHLVELHEFEKKIRVIANLDEGAENSGLFGMGGVPLAELDTQTRLEDRQNELLREMHSQLNLLESAFTMQEDGFSTLLGYLEDKRQLLASTPAIRPVDGGWVTSRFEYRKSPFTGRREFHHGLDIAASINTPVMASADGEVTFSGLKGGLGKAVIINHGRGIVTRYGHLHKCLKKKGDIVKREDIIGLVGNTGQSTGPHLHYEVRIHNVPIDPEKYILN